METIMQFLMDRSIIPFLILFVSAYALVGVKYLKFKSVVKQIIPTSTVKKRIAAGENLIVYIIDPLKCAPCMTQYPKVKQILEEHNLPWVLVDMRDDEAYLHSLSEWRRVPALIAIQNGKPIQLIDASKVFRLRYDQYQDFVNEVHEKWKVA